MVYIKTMFKMIKIIMYKGMLEHFYVIIAITHALSPNYSIYFQKYQLGLLC